VLPLHVPSAHFPSPYLTPKFARNLSDSDMATFYFILLIISFNLHFVNEGIHVSLETKLAFPLGDWGSAPFHACFTGQSLRFVSPIKLRAEIITIKQERVFYVFLSLVRPLRLIFFVFPFGFFLISFFAILILCV
jgi:hypothetical protein